MTASKGVKDRVQRRCSGDHVHQPLEGGKRTKLAQHWPAPLCKAIINGLLDDLHSRTVMAAFHEVSNEEAEYGEGELGSLDYIYDEDDLSRNPILPERVDNFELQRQENLEEAPSHPDLMELEATRKFKWLRIPRETRVAIRRLHHMIGHGSNSAMLQLLRTAGASSEACEAVRHFACETCKKREPVKKAPVVKEPNKMIFNHEISADCFEIHDAAGNRHTVLSVVCLGTLYHQAWWVAAGGVPKSRVCADMLLNGWIQPLGPPRIFTCDRGVHNRGRVYDLLRVHGIQLRFAGLEAPFQIGRTERQGGILKEVLKGAIEERQIIGINDIKMLIAESTTVKNCRVNHHGFTPAQWVLGRLPTDFTSITAEEAESYAPGVQSEIMEPEDEFARQLEIRQAAKMSFAKADSSRRVRAALLRKSVPLRGPYSPGDLVCFHRRNRWHGPARIVGKEGRSTFWIIHAGVPIVVAESQIRPATTSEVMVKQILELRPSRKRKREINEGDDEMPFADDLTLPHLHQEDDQPSYLEIPHEPGLPAPVGEANLPAGAPPGLDLPAELPPPPGLDIAGGPPQEDPAGASSEANMELQQGHQPESEQPPSTGIPTVPSTPAQDQIPQLGLHEALRRSANDLDGHHLRSPRPSQNAHRGRSRSPHREPGNIPVPADQDQQQAFEAELRQDRRFTAFLARRDFDAFLSRKAPKKKRQVGAGRELNYLKSDNQVKEALNETRMKEWNSWKQFQAAHVLPPGPEQDQFLADNPDMVVIPSRWVDVAKSEDPDKPAYKSRLVARGDLEKSADVRTDSPTSSQLFLHTIISYSVCKKRRLRGGDISAAFLQGTSIKRKLALRLPSDGIPDDEVPPGSLLICEKSVYGTCDAPRGFWKELYDTLLECGLKSVPMETSAYYLPGPQGEVLGLLGSHVDDLLWSGGSEMDAVMNEVQKRFKFRMTDAEDSKDGVFKFCGRWIKQTSEGVTITSPEVLDRVKAIYIEPTRRKQRGLAATQSEIGQLRSVVGSLSWYSRVCRPDLAYQVNQLQAVQQKARVEDLLTANRLLNHALETREKGVHFPADAFNFEDAVILCINDASHAASVDVTDGGHTVGHRSQSGRLLALASKEFLESGHGKIHLLQWSSTVIKRVCRSTLQAETLSLQLGSEDSEHVRQILYIIKNKATDLNRMTNFIGAMDETTIAWYTDCRSLSDHLTNVNAAVVSDKRLAIDLTGLRQELWREKGQLVGNPTYCDELPKSGTTVCMWVSTKTMPADCLTKNMHCDQMNDLMQSGRLEMQLELKSAKTFTGISAAKLKNKFADGVFDFVLAAVIADTDTTVLHKASTGRTHTRLRQPILKGPQLQNVMLSSDFTKQALQSLELAASETWLTTGRLRARRELPAKEEAGDGLDNPARGLRARWISFRSSKKCPEGHENRGTVDSDSATDSRGVPKDKAFTRFPQKHRSQAPRMGLCGCTCPTLHAWHAWQRFSSFGQQVCAVRWLSTPGGKHDLGHAKRRTGLCLGTRIQRLPFSFREPVLRPRSQALWLKPRKILCLLFSWQRLLIDERLPTRGGAGSSLPD
eukprot:s298_g8.t1